MRYNSAFGSEETG